jgi:hypothetical protein
VSQFDSEIARYLILTKKNVTNRSFQFLKTNSLILKTNFFFYDNYAQNVTSLNGKNFSQLINNFLFNNTDEIYENSKFFNNNTDKAIKVSVYPHFNFSQTHHYSFTLDFFRADADENS